MAWWNPRTWGKSEPAPESKVKITIKPEQEITSPSGEVTTAKELPSGKVVVTRYGGGGSSSKSSGGGSQQAPVEVKTSTGEVKMIKPEIIQPPKTREQEFQERASGKIQQQISNETMPTTNSTNQENLITINPNTGRPYGVVSLAPTTFEQYKESVNKGGYVRGSLSFLGEKTSGIVTSSGFTNNYQTNPTAKLAKTTVEFGPYFVPYLGESLIIGGATESVGTSAGRQRISETGDILESKYNIPKFITVPAIYGLEVASIAGGASSLKTRVSNKLGYPEYTTEIVGTTTNVKGNTVQTESIFSTTEKSLGWLGKKEKVVGGGYSLSEGNIVKTSGGFSLGNVKTTTKFIGNADDAFYVSAGKDFSYSKQVLDDLSFGKGVTVQDIAKVSRKGNVLDISSTGRGFGYGTSFTSNDKITIVKGNTGSMDLFGNVYGKKQGFIGSFFKLNKDSNVDDFFFKRSGDLQAGLFQRSAQQTSSTASSVLGSTTTTSTSSTALGSISLPAPSIAKVQTSTPKVSPVLKQEDKNMFLTTIKTTPSTSSSTSTTTSTSQATSVISRSLAKTKQLENTIGKMKSISLQQPVQQTKQRTGLVQRTGLKTSNMFIRTLPPLFTSTGRSVYPRGFIPLPIPSSKKRTFQTKKSQFRIGGLSSVIRKPSLVALGRGITAPRVKSKAREETGLVVRPIIVRKGKKRKASKKSKKKKKGEWLV